MSTAHTDAFDLTRTGWTADKLMAAEFDDPRWAVPGVLCEGVTVLAGPPKVGKSWLSLGLGLDIAAGRPAFGSIEIDPGPVLYLALEDTARRLKSRMGKVLAGDDAPSRLTLATDCPPLPQGGDTAIATWLDRNRSARLVVIDVFAKLRGSAPAGVQQYDADYAAVGRIKKVADHYGIAVVLVHHVRKAVHEDFLATVSGTNGITGAADAVLVLERARNNADGVLHVTGRDVEEADYALSFDPSRGAWSMLDGPAIDHTIGDTRSTILRYLRENPGKTPKEVADATQLSADNVRRTCARMHEAEQLTKNASGQYYAPMF
ncbi:AAA family ATPase [Lentzea californiensis]|uniref:AAA family ATPase n=1 Tax=Lentzea californiensis TaxID=438851 RepID=UPI0021648AE3|nr:AAA family ATPase [Lentzea californiensis]MCR3746667.1 Winged helix-turn-helix DNA-binding [Lentzea californiensis]